MTSFDYGAPAELFAGGATNFRRSPLGYRRFPQAADAIRFAVEELSPKLLRGSFLEIDETRYSGSEIEQLYDSVAYPLARGARAATSGPAIRQKR